MYQIMLFVKLANVFILFEYFSLSIQDQDNLYSNFVLQKGGLHETSSMDDFS